MALPVTLRASRDTDSGLFYDVTEQTMRVHVIAAGGAWDEERRRREAAEDSVNPGASVIVADTVGAGILIVERLPNEVRLQALYLFPRYQSQGIGGALVSALQDHIVGASAGCTLIPFEFSTEVTYHVTIVPVTLH